jgi:hypothetical protein
MEIEGVNITEECEKLRIAHAHDDIWYSMLSYIYY